MFSLGANGSAEPDRAACETEKHRRLCDFAGGRCLWRGVYAVRIAAGSSRAERLGRGLLLPELPHRHAGKLCIRLDAQTAGRFGGSGSLYTAEAQQSGGLLCGGLLCRRTPGVPVGNRCVGRAKVRLAAAQGLAVGLSADFPDAHPGAAEQLFSQRLVWRIGRI